MNTTDLILNKICSLYFDKDDEEAHLTGYVVSSNETELICKHINQRGEYDGYIWSRVSDLYRICYEGQYEKKIEDLYCLKSQIHPCFFPKKHSLIEELMDFAKINNYLISVDFRTESITGRVLNCSDNTIRINCIDQFGRDDGVEVVSIDEIVSVSCDTDYEQDLFLYISEIIEKENIE